jgi:hypothetical protein
VFGVAVVDGAPSAMSKTMRPSQTVGSLVTVLISAATQASQGDRWPE